MHEDPILAEDQLHSRLRNAYSLAVSTLTFLPLGLDTRAERYRVICDDGTAYLLKAKSGPLYEPGGLMPRYLRDRGIRAVVAPLATKSGALWTFLGEWNVMLYPFIEGDSSWSGMTAAQWHALGATFRQIHNAPLPPEDFVSPRRETFDPSDYITWSRDFVAQQEGLTGGSVYEIALRNLWLVHRARIERLLNGMAELGSALRTNCGPYVICHADLHPANLLRTDDGQVFVIDWDDVMLAPRERDYIFIEQQPGDRFGLQNSLAFSQGYGAIEVDWRALTYYRYERIAQDLVAFTQEVFFRDDLSQATKADSVQFFNDMLVEGGSLDAAFASVPP